MTAAAAAPSFIRNQPAGIGVTTGSAPSAIPTTLLSGAAETLAVRDVGEARIGFAVSSNTTAMTAGAGWTDLGSFNGSGGSRLSIYVSAVSDAVTGTPPGTIATAANLSVAGVISGIVQVAGSDASIGASATTGSGTGTTISAPSASPPSRTVRVLRLLFASGTSAATPSAPSSYGGENWKAGATTFGTDYSWLIVDDGVYAAGATIPAITATIASSKPWLAATVLVPIAASRPVIVGQSTTQTTFSGTITSTPQALCGITSGTPTAGDGQTGRTANGDVCVLMFGEMNNGDFSATPPLDHTILQGPWTGLARADAGQGIVYTYTATGPVAPTAIGYTAAGINYGICAAGVCVRGVSSVSSASYGPTQAPSSNQQLAPNGTVAVPKALGLYWAICGGTLDTSPSFTDDSQNRRAIDAVVSTTSPAKMRYQLLTSTLLPAGTWTPPYVTQTANNPKNYAAASIVVNGNPQLVTMKAAASVELAAAANDWVAESGTGFEGAAVVELAAAGSFTIDRTRKPRREFVWLYDAEGNQNGVIVN